MGRTVAMLDAELEGETGGLLDQAFSEEERIANEAAAEFLRFPKKNDGRLYCAKGAFLFPKETSLDLPAQSKFILALWRAQLHFRTGRFDRFP